MVTFTNVPKNMDKALYIKTLAHDYKMPLDMIYCLINQLNDENEFFNMLEKNLKNNYFGFKRK